MINETATTTHHPSPGGRSHDLKPVDRKLPEPLRVASTDTRLRDDTYSGIARRTNTFGAATNVFLSSILSQINSATDAEKDWGHFTLVKPQVNHGKTKPNSKATVQPISIKR